MSLAHLHGNGRLDVGRAFRIAAGLLARELPGDARLVRLLPDAHGSRRADGAGVYDVLHHRLDDVRDVQVDPAAGSTAGIGLGRLLGHARRQRVGRSRDSVRQRDGTLHVLRATQGRSGLLSRRDLADRRNVARGLGHLPQRGLVPQEQSRREDPAAGVHSDGHLRYVDHRDARRGRRDAAVDSVGVRLDQGHRRRADPHALLVLRPPAGLFLDHGRLPDLVPRGPDDVRRQGLQRRAHAPLVHLVAAALDAGRLAPSVSRSRDLGRLEVAAHLDDLRRRGALVYDGVRGLRVLRTGGTAGRTPGLRGHGALAALG